MTSTIRWRVSAYFEITLPFSCFRPMWRVRTRPLRQPPFRPSAGVPPTSLRWRTLVSAVWCCCFPTETVKDLHWRQISAVFTCDCPVLCLLWEPTELSLQRPWWLRVWWWSRSCFRLSPPSIVRSSNTWPSSSTTSLYDSSFYYSYSWSICVCSTWKI